MSRPARGAAEEGGGGDLHCVWLMQLMSRPRASGGGSKSTGESLGGWGSPYACGMSKEVSMCSEVSVASGLRRGRVRTMRTYLDRDGRGGGGAGGSDVLFQRKRR